MSRNLFLSLAAVLCITNAPSLLAKQPKPHLSPQQKQMQKKAKQNQSKARSAQKQRAKAKRAI